MIKKLKYLLCLLPLILLLYGCQSSKPPSWASQPRQEDNGHLYGVGYGINQKVAQKQAISHLSSQLWTQVESTSQFRNISNEINGTHHSQSLSDTAIFTKTANLTFNGVQLTQSAMVNDVYYVEASIAKAQLITELKQELDTLYDDIQTSIVSLSHTDPLLWWLNNADTSAYKHEILVKVSVLSALTQGTPEQKYIRAYRELDELVAKTKSSINIQVATTSHEPWLKQFITAYLAQAGLKNTDKATKASHTVEVDTNWRNKKLSSNYISTVLVQLKLKNKNNHTLKSNEIIASANSMSGYDLSKEGAARHFSEQLKTQGLWPSIGL
ncbi:LPP20 family lipoprotein [Photobacterium sp. MCCC 1A19761]|uniref:LPP20 family lipoprotein n=1 Tax=Photobacterium sp. MCCC 1A19761 TaxID=3115000 RepID=UPI00307E703D